jgi:DNA-directed RNA polymerase specialized sigma24 family protein
LRPVATCEAFSTDLIELYAVGQVAASSATDHAERVADALTVRELLNRLSAEHREVLELIYLRGHTVDDTAAALGIPTGTVKSRCFYALQTLRRLIQQEDIDLGAARISNRDHVEPARTARRARRQSRTPAADLT